MFCIPADETDTVYHQLLDVLIDIRNGLDNPEVLAEYAEENRGMCFIVEDYQPDHLHSNALYMTHYGNALYMAHFHLREQTCYRWPHFSGVKAYPVPADPELLIRMGGIGAERLAAEHAYYKLPKYEGHYLEMRRNLVDFWISELKDGLKS